MEQQDAWAALECPLTVSEIERLACFQFKRAAELYLNSIDPEHRKPDPKQVRRFAFAKWMFMTGRITDAVVSDS